MEVMIRENAEAGCRLAAKIMAQLIREKPDCVLGLATGRTPLQLDGELIRLHRTEDLDFSRVTAFNLGEPSAAGLQYLAHDRWVDAHKLDWQRYE